MPGPVPVLDPTVVQRPDEPTRLVVLLHGYGQPVDELVDRLPLLDPDGRHLVVVPTAPFERPGGRVWFRALTGGEEAAAQLRASLRAVDHLLGRLEDQHGLPVDEAVVGGFSQGGCLGLSLLLGADVVHRPAAAFGICSFPPYVDGFRVDPTAAAGRPALVTGDHHDRYAPIDSARSGAVTLRRAGLDLTYAESADGHVLTDEAARIAGTWLASLDGGPPVASAEDALAGVADRAGAYDEMWELVG